MNHHSSKYVAARDRSILMRVLFNDWKTRRIAACSAAVYLSMAVQQFSIGQAAMHCSGNNDSWRGTFLACDLWRGAADVSRQQTTHSRLSYDFQKEDIMHDLHRFDAWPYLDLSAIARLDDMPSAGKASQNGLKERDAAGATDAMRRDDAPCCGPQFLSLVHHGDMGSREYKLFIPSAREGQSSPLLVMLHGCNQTADDFARGTGMNDIAERHGCFVAYPAQSLCANQLQCWNWHRPEDQRRDQGEPAIIAGLTRAIAADYPIDRQRIYIAGLSAGGAMAATMGSLYADLYAAVGIHSGLPHGAAHDLLSAYDAMKHGAHQVDSLARTVHVPTIVFHGDRDTTVHPANADHLMQHAATETATETEMETEMETPAGTPYAAHTEIIRRHPDRQGRYAHTRTVRMDRSRKIVFEQWLIHGAGHAWSGGRPDGSFTDAKGPDASREMMRFFCEITPEAR